MVRGREAAHYCSAPALWRERRPASLHLAVIRALVRSCLVRGGRPPGRSAVVINPTPRLWSTYSADAILRVIVSMLSDNDNL